MTRNDTLMASQFKYLRTLNFNNTVIEINPVKKEGC